MNVNDIYKQFTHIIFNLTFFWLCFSLFCNIDFRDNWIIRLVASEFNFQVEADSVRFLGALLI